MTNRMAVVLGLSVVWFVGCASTTPRSLSWNSKPSMKSGSSDSAGKSSGSKKSNTLTRKSKTNSKSTSEESSTASANYGERKPGKKPSIDGAMEKALAAENRALAAEENQQPAEAEKRLNEAKQLYEKVLKQDPGNPTVLHRMAVIADKQHRFDESEKLYLQVLKIKPEDASVLTDLGYSYVLQNRPREAEQKFRAALKANPDYRFALGNLGQLLAQQAQVTGNRQAYDDAFEMFRRAGGEQQAQDEMAKLFPKGPPHSIAQTGNPPPNPFAENRRDAQPPLSQASHPGTPDPSLPQREAPRNAPPKQEEIAWGDLRDQFERIDRETDSSRTPSGTAPIGNRQAPQGALRQTAGTEPAAGGNWPAAVQTPANTSRLTQSPAAPRNPTATQPNGHPSANNVAWDLSQQAPSNSAPEFPSNGQGVPASPELSLENLNVAPPVDPRQPTQGMEPISNHVGIADESQQQPWQGTPASGIVPPAGTWDDAQRVAAQLSMTQMFPMTDAGGNSMPQTGFPNTAPIQSSQGGSPMYRTPGGSSIQQTIAPSQIARPSAFAAPPTQPLRGTMNSNPAMNLNRDGSQFAPQGGSPAAGPEFNQMQQYDAGLPQTPANPNSRTNYAPIQGEQPVVRPATANYR